MGGLACQAVVPTMTLHLLSAHVKGHFHPGFFFLVTILFNTILHDFSGPDPC